MNKTKKETCIAFEKTAQITFVHMLITCMTNLRPHLFIDFLKENFNIMFDDFFLRCQIMLMTGLCLI
jgi:hypothetical protein